MYHDLLNTTWEESKQSNTLCDGSCSNEKCMEKDPLCDGEVERQGQESCSGNERNEESHEKASSRRKQ